jgi:uncharacterized membrane protein
MREKGRITMKALIWTVGILALLAVIIGATIKAAAFLLWVAPILLVIAVLLFILNRSGGRRIPR